MTSRERVEAVIRHEQPDRIPIYGWVRANLSDPITKAFGSVDAFEDHYEFDFAHLFGGPGPSIADPAWHANHSNPVEPPDIVDLPLTDPDNDAAYDSLRMEIRHHKEERGRFIYVQTPGIFECLNGTFGIQDHLCYLLLHEDELHTIYRRQAEWNRRFAMNCLDLGVDMVHVSDDWGAQWDLMFSPETWWRLIYPYHKITADAVKQRGAFLSLHSDGNINSVLDGVLGLGYDVVHPWQESAGMSLEQARREFRGKLTVMGGLDVQTTIGFGNLDFLAAEIDRVMQLFADGGLLFCTTHFVQDHCSIDELTFAFDRVYKLSRTLGRG